MRELMMVYIILSIITIAISPKVSLGGGGKAPHNREENFLLKEEISPVDEKLLSTLGPVCMII